MFHREHKITATNELTPLGRHQGKCGRRNRPRSHRLEAETTSSQVCEVGCRAHGVSTSRSIHQVASLSAQPPRHRRVMRRHRRGQKVDNIGHLGPSRCLHRAAVATTNVPSNSGVAIFSQSVRTRSIWRHSTKKKLTQEHSKSADLSRDLFRPAPSTDDFQHFINKDAA